MNSQSRDAPFIITAELPADLAKWATSLRTAHFPAERNYLKAHVTLFHALPPSCEGEIKTALSAMAAANSPVPGRLEGIMPLGRGTALRLSSPTMIDIWRELADRFHGLLTPQDEHRPRLHVTIQNKVSPAESKFLQAELSPLFEVRDFRFAGLSLHIYRGGPWEFVRTYQFRGSSK
ncbi:2'-5' RNA ligase family protein [Pontixanthobacter gangjinensis]|uniref:2'-5' RNA ligase family protein n=1 Tax=Pontixanthobacter gangjinensis TaxID=1028742 RepID=A0A6I4SNU2_9SPHN|nr:2'-5' RNA ligase family protein [Pontixanthobacter gangjinensis]MXO57309.1 2'-5' RNA ligase family protein [Pontixanthobacter gangjinensis]